jgi:hypothetical protein
VRNAKKTHNAINEISVHFSFIFNKSINPKTSSNATTKIAISNVKFCKKVKLKTSGEKYSSSLKEKPFTSIAFTKPDAMKIMATMYLKILFI